MWRFLIGVGFAVVVSVVCLILGASASVSWLTFLIIVCWAALVEVGIQVDGVAQQVAGIEERQKEMQVFIYDAVDEFGYGLDGKPDLTNRILEWRKELRARKE